MHDNLMKHGAFGWNELMTTDVAAARQFYGALFGWETEDYPGEGMHYVMVKVGGAAVGGMRVLPPARAGMPPARGVHVAVAAVDAPTRPSPNRRRPARGRPVQAVRGADPVGPAGIATRPGRGGQRWIVAAANAEPAIPRRIGRHRSPLGARLA